jgi:hypothetical protein
VGKIEAPPLHALKKVRMTIICNHRRNFILYLSSFH